MTENLASCVFRQIVTGSFKLSLIYRQQVRREAPRCLQPSVKTQFWAPSTAATGSWHRCWHCTILPKCFFICLHTHMNLSNISLSIHRVSWYLPTLCSYNSFSWKAFCKVQTVFTGTFDHYSQSAFVR